MSHSPVAVYRASDPIEIQSAQGILQATGIEAAILDQTVSPYPMSVGPLADRRLLVASDAAEAAVELLAEAAADGLLTPGNLIQEEMD